MVAVLMVKIASFIQNVIIAQNLSLILFHLLCRMAWIILGRSSAKLEFTDNISTIRMAYKIKTMPTRFSILVNGKFNVKPFNCLSINH